MTGDGVRVSGVLTPGVWNSPGVAFDLEDAALAPLDTNRQGLQLFGYRLNSEKEVIECLNPWLRYSPLRR